MEGVLLAMASNLSPLLADLQSADPASREAAAESLCHLGEDARDAAVPLVRACADSSESVLEWATAALEDLGPPNPNDVADLSSLVSSEQPDVAYWAATLVGRAGPASVSAVGLLKQAVAAHPVLAARQRAAWALGKIGPGARDALDVLRAAADSDDPRLARLAAQAIDEIEASR